MAKGSTNRKIGIRRPIMRELSGFVRRVVALVRPHKIVLFGSRAGGRPRRDSDVDLCIILNRGTGRRVSNLVYGVERSFALDLVIFTSDQIRWRLREGDCFLRDILDRGIVLYETPHVRVG